MVRDPAQSEAPPVRDPTSLHDHSDVHTVDELHKQGHRPPCQHCNCGNSTVFCTVVTQTPVVVQQRASQPCPRTTPVRSHRSSAQFGLWEHASSKRPKRRPAQQGHRSLCQSTATAPTQQFSALTTPSTNRWTQRACQRLCPRLQTRLCMSTGTMTIDELHEEDIDRRIPVLISSPRGWARLGEQFRPRVRAQLRTFFRTGKSAKNPYKSLICIVTQTTR